MKKGKIKVLLAAVFILTGFLYIVLTLPKDDIKIKEKLNIKNEIREYEKYSDENGNLNLNMSDPNYFLIRQKASEYQNIKEFEYFSKLLNQNRKANILLPKDYDEKKAYPLLVILHGYEGNRTSWLNKRADVLIQNLKEFENIRDYITIFYDSNINRANSVKKLSFKDAVGVFDRSNDDLMNELLPVFVSQFKISDKVEDRSICGLSLGGRNAMYIGLSNMDFFGNIGSFSPANITRYDEKNDAFPITNSFEQYKDEYMVKNPYIEITTGDRDDDTGKDTKDIIQDMKEIGFKLNDYTLTGGHESRVWQMSLYNFLKNIERNKYEKEEKN